MLTKTSCRVNKQLNAVTSYFSGDLGHQYTTHKVDVSMMQDTSERMKDLDTDLDYSTEYFLACEKTTQCRNFILFWGFRASIAHTGKTYDAATRQGV